MVTPMTKGIAEVWKFPMTHLSGTHLIPIGAVPIHVHDQDGEPCIWFRVDPGAKKERRTFIVIATGSQFSTRYQYLGTAHCGSFVWHVFEVPNE